MSKSCINCKYFATSVTELPCCHCRDNNQYEPRNITASELCEMERAKKMWEEAKSEYEQALMKKAYVDTDITSTRRLYLEWVKHNTYVEPSKAAAYRLRIKDVIFNEPATIVFWADGTKTVVKCHAEKFDPEKGLAMAITKKALGNKYDYYNQVKHWLKKYRPRYRPVDISISTEEASKAMHRLAETCDKYIARGSDE